MIDSISDNKDSSRIHWHPAFYSGIELELKDYADALTFDREYQLSKEPLKMDMLVIKKNSDIEIKNHIGRIFRRHNILEFKSPDDALSIDDYIKAIGYAYIYKGLGKTVNEIPLEELTVSLIRDVYPRELVKTIKDSGGNVIEEFPGIYYVTGLVAIPTQIIVTSKINGDEHAALKLLSRRTKIEDVKRFVKMSEKLKAPGDVNNINSILQVNVTANKDLYDKIRRDDDMCQALMDLFSDEIEKREEATEEATLETAVTNLMKNMNLSAEEAMNILEIPAEKRKIFMVRL